MTSLPSLTRVIDDAFTTTWYEIRKDAIDNILDSVNITAALREKGCFTPETGGQILTRTIRHGTKTATAVAKGDTLSSGEDDIETLANWDWRYSAAHIQRSLQDDQKNAGPSKIKDRIAVKLEAAADSIEQKIETDFFRAFTSGEGGKNPHSFLDMVPLVANQSTSTYGKITRPSGYSTATAGTVSKPNAGNTWWGPTYLAGTVPNHIHLLSDMKKIYNSTHNNQEPPDLIISDQGLFEIYEDFALDASQIIKDESTRLADLGFEVLRFKGKPMIWSTNVTADHMLFLTTKYIEIIYDPNYWFDMTEWKAVELQFERIAHIIATWTMICSQPRRQARLYY